MTKAEFKVNREFTQNYTEDEVVEKFIYFTNPDQGKRCTEKAIRKAYYNNRIGSLIRRHDPIQFNLLAREL
jgi:hypothetical protein